MNLTSERNHKAALVWLGDDFSFDKLERNQAVVSPIPDQSWNQDAYGVTPTPTRKNEEASTVANNKAILVRHFNEILNQGLLEIVDEIYSSDYILDAPVRSDGSSQKRSLTQGREQLKQRVTLFRTAFPDIHFTLDEIIGEDDTVVVHYTYRGTHKGVFTEIEPSGRSIDITGILIAHLMYGKIQSALSVFDSADLIMQLSN